MGTDNLNCLVDCPKPKKSRTSKEESYSSWCYLPTVILHEVFLLLNQRERLNASSVCRNWRHSLYHPIWWKDVTFRIYENELSKARYLISAFSNIVSNATIKFDSMSPECAEEFITLLYFLSENENLKSLVVEPRCCRIEMPVVTQRPEECSMRHLVNLMLKCCRRSLSKFSIGGVEEFLNYLPDFLEVLSSTSPEKMTHLGLGSVKDDPGNYNILPCDLELLKPFNNLQILSVDYDIVCDDFLHALNSTKDLRRLVVHVHGVHKEHSGTSELAWKNFKRQHPLCELRLSLIHAYKEVHFLGSILKENMPLSHLKVFFCENVNFSVLHNIPVWYPETFRSLSWIDSQSYGKTAAAYSFVSQEGLGPDPLVMIAWLCPKLEELVLFGYKYFVEDLVAIARLRSDSLRVLEVAQDDVIWSDGYVAYLNSKNEVTSILKQSWSPLTSKELHPVICDSTAGDSDEYLLPRVLADLQ